jgi:hypothetical protein
MDAFASSDLSDDDDAPSPKKALPDFTTRKSDDDSVASGDDSAGWEAEEDRVMNAFFIQTEAQDALEDLFADAGPMKEIHEFELIASRVVDGEEEGNAEVDPTTTTAGVLEYETRRVVLKTTNVKTLKAITTMLKLSTHGKKQLLFNRIRDSLGVTKVSDDEFEYRHASVVGAKVPTWVILTPEAVPSVNGIDMGWRPERILWAHEQGECCWRHTGEFFDVRACRAADVRAEEAKEEEEGRRCQRSQPSTNNSRRWSSLRRMSKATPSPFYSKTERFLRYPTHSCLLRLGGHGNESPCVRERSREWRVHRLHCLRPPRSVQDDRCTLRKRPDSQATVRLLVLLGRQGAVAWEQPNQQCSVSEELGDGKNDKGGSSLEALPSLLHCG